MLTWIFARFMSRRVMAEMLRSGMDGAKFLRIKAFVLAGLPTTSTLTVFLAYVSSAWPWTLKMDALAFSRSLRSMPTHNRVRF